MGGEKELSAADVAVTTHVLGMCKLVPRGHSARPEILEKFALLTSVYISNQATCQVQGTQR